MENAAVHDDQTQKGGSSSRAAHNLVSLNESMSTHHFKVSKVNLLNVCSLPNSVKLE